MEFRHRALALSAVVVSAVGLSAAPPQPIGIALGESTFQAGSSVVKGQSTLFEGDLVRSQYFATRLNLRDGSRYVLGIASEGVVRRDHLLLRSGSAELLNAGRPASLVASGFRLTADAPASSATVYVGGKDLVTVLVRKGEVKVSRMDGAQPTTLRAGQAVSLRNTGKSVEIDSRQALDEVVRVQGDQVDSLAEAARDFNCLEPRVSTLSRSFAGLSAQVAANQAARAALMTRVDAGFATSSDMRTLADLDNGLASLRQSSAALSEELNQVIFDHHPGPPPPSVSPHTTHDHQHPQHHGEHGHSVDPSGGHHAVPPHTP